MTYSQLAEVIKRAINCDDQTAARAANAVAEAIHANGEIIVERALIDAMRRRIFGGVR